MDTLNVETDAKTISWQVEVSNKFNKSLYTFDQSDGPLSC